MRPPPIGTPRRNCCLSGQDASDGAQALLARHLPDVIDELVEAVIDEGGSIDHVEADTKLKDYTSAATLRFPLPPMTSPGA
jgi:hypothetical protein